MYNESNLEFGASLEGQIERWTGQEKREMRRIFGSLRRIKEIWWVRLASEKFPKAETATHQSNDGQDWLDNVWSL